MAISITNNNLFSESYKSVKDFLNSISGLDPRGRYKANWIHASMPNINQKGFDGYPFIVLKVNASEEDRAFDYAIGNKFFRVEIGVYSDDSSQLDTLCDSILSGIKDETKLTNFSNKDFSSSPVNWNLDMSGKKILFRIINIIARSRI
jgi:hypothetical protein